MKQVREVSYDIGDCFDDVNHRLGREPRGSGALVYFRKKWYLLTTLYARRCIATEIRNLKVRAQHVSDRRTRYGVENLTDKDGGDGGADNGDPTDRLTPPLELIGTKKPVGVEHAIAGLGGWFEEAKRDTQAHKKFLAIYGFGGLGKTTLAEELYTKFGDDYDCRASVQASQKFNLVMLLRSLVNQFQEQQAGASQHVSHDKIEELGQKGLKDMLGDQLKNKRYFIFIDDIWSVSAWEDINDSLPEKNASSPKTNGAIMVTTRFKSVAVACCRRNGRLHEHKKLPDENSYKLFRQIISDFSDSPIKAAPDGQITFASVNLTGDERALLKKCGGLPLAIIVVSGLVASKLRSGTTSKTLDEHLQEVNKALSGGLGTHLSTEGVKTILNQCYNDLPADLKTCLLYLSMFPKGIFISRKRLIRRWIAEGFIIEKHGRTVEEVAEDYFSELINRNLIRAVNNSSNGKVKNYQIHDMVLEYIVAKSSDENFITVVGGHWQTPFPSYKGTETVRPQKRPRRKKDGGEDEAVTCSVPDGI
uniref:Uncharacterized protein n=1 Tax=Aegilops tauschii subsp. strangulata TaxID=200361 RepID=A0A453LF31_AEGTS